jgi:RND superfamily putative drug exporter
MKHPWVTSLSIVVVLFALATPALSAEFAQIDDRVLAKDNEVAVAAAILRDEFNSNESAPAHVVFDRATSESQVAKFARLASELPEVVRVETQNGLFRDGQFTPLGAAQGWPAATMETEDHQRVIVVADIKSRSRAVQVLIDSLRSIDSMVLVGGAAADYTDSQAGISRQLPWALLWVALTTFVVLFLYTGSILLPVKAILLNVLSLTATMGVLTWMFQYGNLMWLTGEYTVTSTLDSSSLVLIAIVTFGLSMDYEVFLLSRIKEEHDRGLDTTEAVALGLQRSGRIITAAAVLLAIVFGAFVTSSVTSMKMLGFGIAFAILMDATVVRGLLVPALMRIAGKYNWWAPKPLRAIHQRFGLQD